MIFPTREIFLMQFRGCHSQFFMKSKNDDSAPDKIETYRRLFCKFEVVTLVPYVFFVPEDDATISFEVRDQDSALGQVV